MLTCMKIHHFRNLYTLVKSNDIKLNFRLRVFNPDTPMEDFKGGSAFRANQISLNKIYNKKKRFI